MKTTKEKKQSLIKGECQDESSRDIHLNVYYVKDLERIYDVIMNITTFIWPDDNTQWSQRQAFY